MKKLTSLLPKILFLLILTTFFGAAFLGNVEAVSTWQKYPGNPISFDENITALDPYILKENDIYKMFYVGNEGSGWRTEYANSSNGLEWQRNIEPVIIIGSSDGWESGTENANVIKKSSSNDNLSSASSSSCWFFGK